MIFEINLFGMAAVAVLLTLYCVAVLRTRAPTGRSRGSSEQSSR